MLRRTIAPACRLPLAAALLGAAALAAVAAEPEPVGPRVAVERLEIDLGQVSRGATVEARFELRNVGDRDLRILEAKPG